MAVSHHAACAACMLQCQLQLLSQAALLVSTLVQETDALSLHGLWEIESACLKQAA